MSSSAPSSAHISAPIDESAEAFHSTPADLASVPAGSCAIAAESSASDPAPRKIFQGPHYQIAPEIQQKLSQSAALDSVQPRQGRRRRQSRRSLLFAKLRSLTARVWSRFPLFYAALPPALPSGDSYGDGDATGFEETLYDDIHEETHTPEQLATSTKFFFRPKKKKRKGRPEGTKGAGSRSI